MYNDTLLTAFQRGFMKRADEWCFPTHKAKEMFAKINPYTMFGAHGFSDRQLGKEAEFSHSFDSMSNTLFPHSFDSLFDVAERSDAAHTSHKDLHAVGSMAGHMANNALPLAASGAGLGALHGLTTAKNDEDKLKRAGKHGLLGGLLGFGGGAVNDAYHLGDNTRNQLVDYSQEEREHFNPNDHENQNRINTNIDALKKSRWYEFYNPEHIEQKLK